MLPNNAKEVAAGYDRLPAKRKSEILDHIERSANPRKTAAAIVSNGGEAGEFVAHILGKADAAPEAAMPKGAKNKRSNPPQVK
jgi:hypothetical protein